MGGQQQEQHPNSQVYLKNGSLYVKKPDGNYMIYSYDPNWFNSADPTTMTPREIFDELYGEDSRYNPYTRIIDGGRTTKSQT
jgi:hypothetical protein